MPDTRGNAGSGQEFQPASPKRDDGAARGGGPKRAQDTARDGGPWATSGQLPSMLMRISVPAEGDLRELAGEVGTKIAEYLGSHKPDAASIAEEVHRLAGKVAPPGSGSNITFEFHAAKGELVVHAHCDGRSSETRHRLPA